MKFIKSVDFSEIKKVYAEEHMLSRSYVWTPGLLEHANSFYLGKWSLVELSSKEIKDKITLMWHKDGEIELIPQEGATVRKTAEKLLSIEKEYETKNIECYNRIKVLSTVPFNAVFIASQSPGGFKIKEHEKVTPPTGNYFHLDGTHRMISWYIAGRFSFFKYFFGKKLLAYIAGELK